MSPLVGLGRTPLPIIPRWLQHFSKLSISMVFWHRTVYPAPRTPGLAQMASSSWIWRNSRFCQITETFRFNGLLSFPACRSHFILLLEDIFILMFNSDLLVYRRIIYFQMTFHITNLCREIATKHLGVISNFLTLFDGQTVQVLEVLGLFEAPVYLIYLLLCPLAVPACSLAAARLLGWGFYTTSWCSIIRSIEEHNFRLEPLDMESIMERCGS